MLTGGSELVSTNGAAGADFAGAAVRGGVAAAALAGGTDN